MATFFEKYESRSENITGQGISAQRIFISDWTSRHANAPKIGDPYPDLLGAYCSRVAFEPTGKSTATGPELAKIIAEYSSRDISQQQDTEYVDESLDFGGEMISKGGGKWESDDTPVEENDPGAVTFYPRAQYVRTFVIDDITGWAKKIYKATAKLNSDSFLGAPKETWLFQGADVVKFVDSAGAFKWRMTFRFVYRESGWNYTWRKDDPDLGGKWDKLIFTDEDGKQRYRYETTSFKRLLTQT